MSQFPAIGVLALGVCLLIFGVALLLNLGGAAARLSDNARQAPPRGLRLFVLLWPDLPLVWRLGGLLMVGMAGVAIAVAWHALGR
jgi:hypothetical protein